MRTPIVAGNWKMNKTAAEGRAFMAEILPGLQAVTSVERVICPPFTALESLSKILEGSGVGLGAQNIFWEESGAYTGEIAPAMIKEFCQYVIIGHSERRQYFGESDDSVNKRVKTALATGLTPIICIGETLEENENNKTEAVVTRQITEGLKGLTPEQASSIIVAYEPIWAIGTGRAASGAGANLVVGVMIRPALESMFGSQVSEAMRVQYGGSVKPGNAAEFFSQPEIDGALVGGACLKPDFAAIVEAAARAGL